MKTIPNSLLPLALVVTLVAITPLAGGQSTFTTLYSFTNGVPQSLVSSNGAFFGAFGGVGASGSECGAIFQLQPPAIESGDWAEEAVYSFSGAGQGPCNPDFGPAIGSNGALYGLTTQGGAYGEGTLYMLEPPNSAGGVWTAAVLYSFGAAGTYDAPGGGGLIPGPGGSYYFLSSAGGAYGYGALVQMQPPTVPGAGWSASILYSFPEGVMANSITVGPGGVFYGTAAPFEEVKRQYGLVFRIFPPADSPKGEWTLSVLYTFLPGEGTTGNPIALTVATDGVLYGAASGRLGEAGAANGGVFRLTPPPATGGSWTYALLADFGAQHQHPDVPLVLRDGKLYGALALASGTAPPSGGALFEMQPPLAPGGAWTTTYLHGFGDGQTPMYTLIMRSDGTLYGVTTDYYASPNTGTVYSIKP